MAISKYKAISMAAERSLLVLRAHSPEAKARPALARDFETRAAIIEAALAQGGYRIDASGGVVKMKVARATPASKKPEDLCSYCNRPCGKGSALIDGQAAHKSCIKEFDGD